MGEGGAKERRRSAEMVEKDRNPYTKAVGNHDNQSSRQLSASSHLARSVNI